jgi:hypothetical protein
MRPAQEGETFARLGTQPDPETLIRGLRVHEGP